MYNNFPCCVIIMIKPDIAWKICTNCVIPRMDPERCDRDTRVLIPRMLFFLRFIVSRTLIVRNLLTKRFEEEKERGTERSRYPFQSHAFSRHPSRLGVPRKSKGERDMYPRTKGGRRRVRSGWSSLKYRVTSSTEDDDAGSTAVTYRLNIFRWPGRHQWSITGGQRAGGHPGRQVLAKLRLRSNIRVITRYYTEHVDGLAEAGSPTTTNIATSSSWLHHHHLLHRPPTTNFVFASSLSFSPPLALPRYFRLFLLSPASVKLSISLLCLLATFARSLLGHDRECGVLVSLYHRHHHRHHLRYRLHVSLFLSSVYAVSARGSRLSRGSA